MHSTSARTPLDEMVTTSTRAMEVGRTYDPEGDSASARTTPRDESSADETAKINWAAHPLPDYSAGRNKERSDRTRARRAMTRATTGTRRAAKDILTLRDQLNELAGRGDERTAHAAARLLQWAARTHRRNVERPRHRNSGEAGAPADTTSPSRASMSSPSLLEVVAPGRLAAADAYCVNLSAHLAAPAAST